jgi:hypothetical protein
MFFPFFQLLQQPLRALWWRVLMVTDERFADAVVVEQLEGHPCILGGNDVNTFEHFKGSQSYVA